MLSGVGEAKALRSLESTSSRICPVLAYVSGRSFTINNLPIIINPIHRANILVNRSSSICIILCVR
jgi:hypothetical protein